MIRHNILMHTLIGVLVVLLAAPVLASQAAPVRQLDVTISYSPQNPIFKGSISTGSIALSVGSSSCNVFIGGNPRTVSGMPPGKIFVSHFTGAFRPAVPLLASFAGSVVFPDDPIYPLGDPVFAFEPDTRFPEIGPEGPPQISLGPYAQGLDVTGPIYAFVSTEHGPEAMRVGTWEVKAVTPSGKLTQGSAISCDPGHSDSEGVKSPFDIVKDE